VLFIVQGCGQQPLAKNWGDGLATDAAVVAAMGLSDPNPFFSALMQKPYLSQARPCRSPTCLRRAHAEALPVPRRARGRPCGRPRAAAAGAHADRRSAGPALCTSGRAAALLQRGRSLPARARRRDPRRDRQACLPLRRGARPARACARQVVVGPHVYPPSISGGYGDRTSVSRPATLSFMYLSVCPYSARTPASRVASSRMLPG